MPGVRFGFKRLDVYQAALVFWQWALRVATRIPRNRFFVTDQFLRAALSISLNIAESAGNKTPAEAANHCRHAAGSTTECAALLDSLLAMKVIDEKEYDEQEERLARIAAMLTRLLQRHERRSRNRTT
ncbi:MAG: four helix bundle protein [Gemmatimonadota bacterium]